MQRQRTFQKREVMLKQAVADTVGQKAGNRTQKIEAD